MSDSGNRSLSPRSTSGPTSSERASDSLGKNGGTIGRVLNFFRKRSREESKQEEQLQSGTNYQQLRRAKLLPQSEKNDYKDWKMTLSLANEPLNNSFEATKKRRMLTIQALKTAAINNGSIPRSASIVDPENGGGLFSSISGSLANGLGNGTDEIGTNFGAVGVGASGMPGGYLTFFTARQAQQDLLNDLEQRRRSIIDRDVHYYAMETPEKIVEELSEDDNLDNKDYGELVESDQPASRLISPMDGVLVHPPSHIHSQLQTELDYEAGDKDNDVNDDEIVSDDEAQQGEGNLPLIIEHEFAPLYRDVNGNLVRPPFINLDPRERYHLLQLKKSVEASESLQSRIKYMTNPLETHSRRIPQTNKVETSTQTHDYNSLYNSLNFVRKRRIERDIVSDEPRTKKTKNSKGYFVCDFDYEVPEEPPKKIKSSSNLQGYLGEVSAPSIKDKLPKEEGAKSTSQRYGLDDLFSGKKSREDVKLDSEYLATSKIREKKTTVESADLTLPKSQPSLFATNPPPAKSFGTTSAPSETKSLFGASNATGVPAAAPSLPSFSFGKQAPSDEQNEPKRKRSLRDVDESTKAEPAFSFSGGNETSKPKAAGSNPVVNFGSKSTELKSNSPAFSSGVKEDHKTSEAVVPQKQTFSFGVPDKKDDSKVDFSFGSNTTAKKDDVPKLNFSFGATPDASSEKKDDTSIPKPLFSFGGAPNGNLDKKPGVQNPTFSLGGVTSSTEKKNDLPKPSFSFLAVEKKDDSVKPAFSFGLDKKTESTSTNNASQTGGAKGDTKAAFSFGSTIAPKEGTTSSPSFSFGNSSAPIATEKKNEIPKPAFTFGEKKDEPSKPAFSFGADSSTSAVTPTSSDKKEGNVPVFNFGSSVKPASPFTFGSSNAAQNATGNISTDQANKPAFSFGAAAQPKSTLPLTNNQVGGAVGNSKAGSPAPFSFGSNGAGSSPKVETPKPISTAFSFGNNNVPNGTNGFGGGSAFNVSTPLTDKTLGGGLSQPLQQQQILQPFSFGQANSGVSSSQQFGFGAGASTGTAVSNPNSREVSPAFNFQKSGASSSPNLNMGFQHQTPIQPLLVPNINFASGGSASADPSAIFSSTTPPPTTGTPPLVRGGRRIALPRSRRR